MNVKKRNKKYGGLAKSLLILGIVGISLGMLMVLGDIFKAINHEFDKFQLIGGIIVSVVGALLLTVFQKYKRKINGKTIWELVYLKNSFTFMLFGSILIWIIFFSSMWIPVSISQKIGDIFVIIIIPLALFFPISAFKLWEIDHLPIKCVGTSIYINVKPFSNFKPYTTAGIIHEFNGSIYIEEKEPTIYVYVDDVKVVEYRLQNRKEEDFTNQYFLISVRVGFTGEPLSPVMQVDGFISDTPFATKMELNDIGYRMERHHLAFGGDISKKKYEAICGRDLIEKGLRYPGYTTPGNVRLIGICPSCKKSFAFQGYNIYLNHNEPVYSDDGLNVCYISGYEMDAQKFDKENWAYEKNGKTYRYYNSFRCPHCGEPYIDYNKYKEMKTNGICACSFLDEQVEQIEL